MYLSKTVYGPFRLALSKHSNNFWSIRKNHRSCSWVYTTIIWCSGTITVLAERRKFILKMQAIMSHLIVPDDYQSHRRLFVWSSHHTSGLPSPSNVNNVTLCVISWQWIIRYCQLTWDSFFGVKTKVEPTELRRGLTAITLGLATDCKKLHI